MVQAIMPLWFYATPIVYTLNLLPQQLQFLFLFNPLTAIIQLFQFVLLNQMLPPFIFILANLLGGAAIAILGWFVFLKESPFFDDWI
jgi:lipopolysaccharide transport system permease protein